MPCKHMQLGGAVSQRCDAAEQASNHTKTSLSDEVCLVSGT